MRVTKEDVEAGAVQNITPRPSKGMNTNPSTGSGDRKTTCGTAPLKT